ncbi:MAG: exodeoxyribonuclease V subunit gamma [Deltaproteobacteria bacterium]
MDTRRLWTDWLDALAASLATTADPFTETPVILGEPRLEKWIRHRIAERVGIATQLTFVPLDGALEALLRAPESEPWWRWAAPDDHPWALAQARARVIAALRALNASTPCGLPADLSAYLYPRASITTAASMSTDAVAWRELAFAETVASVILRLCRERPATALAWGRGGPADPSWLGAVCKLIGTADTDSPAALRDPTRAPRVRHASLHVAPLTAAPASVARLLEAHGAPAVARDVSSRTSLASALPRERVRLRPCHGPLREVEVLREWLLDRFDAPRTDPCSLDPQDVLVLSPAPETYGPLVLSVFARTGGGSDVTRGAPAIPVHVRHLGDGRRNPVADVLLRLLEIADERFDAPRLLGLLECQPVQARFQLSAEDVTSLRSLVAESGARWGFDAADRASHGQVEWPQNTISHGLERLALGRLMPTDSLVVSADRAYAHVVTMDTGDREVAARTATLATIVTALETEVATLRRDGAATTSAWRERLDALLDTFADQSAAMAWLRLDVSEKLDASLPSVEGQPGLPLTRGAVRRLLENAFTLPLSTRAPSTGTVTFDALTPHCARPARVIALLGMNDGAYPRSPTLPAWDPFSKLDSHDEVDPRALDRALLFDLAQSAEDTLWISWTGYEMKRGEPVPPCVPVEELARAVEPAFDSHSETYAAAPIDAVFRLPARHPWAERHGAGTWDRDFAVPVGGARAPRERDPLDPIDPGLPGEITADALADALVEPAKHLIQRRLEVYLPEDEAEIASREPIDQDYLLRWKLRQELLAEYRDTSGAFDRDATFLRVTQRLQGKGAAMAGVAGSIQVETELNAVGALWAKWTSGHGDASQPDATAAATIDLGGDLGSLVVRAEADRITPNGDLTTIERLTVSSTNTPEHALKTWIVQLVFAASGEHGSVDARMYGLKAAKADIVAFQPVAAAAARDRLLDLVRIWAEARRRPLPLFEQTSPTLAEGDDQTTRFAAEAVWYDGSYVEERQPAERDTQWLAPLHRDYDLHTALGAQTSQAYGPRDLADRVWGELGKARMAASKEKKPAKTTASGKSDE